MALEAVAGALLSSSLQFLFERIDSGEVLAYLRGTSKSRDIDQLIEKLKKVLSTVMAVIEDAEKKQRKSKSVVVWLDMLQDAIFDAEDLLDVIETESSIEMSKTRILFKDKIQKFISQSSSSEAGNLRSKVKKLLKKLEDIAERNDCLGLEKSVDIPEQTFWRLPSTSLVDESEVYGIDNDKDEVLKFVLSTDEGDYEKTRVISIVGMGGVGKTTLAQIAFNDEKVKEEFEVNAWVCVSEEFDVCRATKSILEEVTSRSCDVTELNSLQVKLKERLIGKKFLIVLDDVWLEKPAGLDVLFLPFKCGAKGSKIIVTTRSEKVASCVCSDQTHFMNKLPEESSWQLFAKEASGKKNAEFQLEAELERIGREIVKKCDGLPLALKTLGGLLRSTVDAREWRRIVESDIWDLSEDESDILPALKLSYHYLPSLLKRCFAFCSIFPSDYEFEREELILLWMAENLLECPNRNRRIEDVGEDSFNGLVSRSFFQRSNSRDSVFVMHDLIHDLAKSVSAEYCLRLEDGSTQSQLVKMKKARHLGYAFRDVDHYERFSNVFEATKLRTFLSVEGKYCFRLISKRTVTDLLSKLERLRVLSFFGYYNIEDLPDSIGKLRHLRYLDVSCTSISKLPESVCDLFNLQTLKLKSCKRLKNLPKHTYRLVNLKHLDLRNCDSLVEMPKQLSKLKKLQTLSTFIVGKDNGTKIGELKELTDLRGKLYLKNLENVEVGPLDELLQMKRLDWVSFEWRDDHNDDSQHARKVLDMLKPDGILTELYIHGYSGVGFPNWLGFNNSLDCLVSLRISKCRNCTSLPPLGQLPYLKALDISNFDALVDVGPEFYHGGGSSRVIDPFRSLEILKFSSMKSWAAWLQSDSKAFLQLTKLHLSDCRKLNGVFPCFLPSLTELRISGCESLALSLPRIPRVRVLILSGLKDIMQLESSINSLESCEFMEFSFCSVKVRMPIGSLPANFKYLVIQECKGLDIECDRPHASLEELNVHTCDAFQSLPMDYFPKLKKLTIGVSERLESLSTSKCLQALEHNLAISLTSLHIWGCSSLIHFPNGGLFAPNLTHLQIRNCKRLKALPEKMTTFLISLKFLTMTDCPALESFPRDSFPSSLTELKIFDCERFIASRKNWGLEQLPNLITFVIKGSDEELESFPEEGLLPKTIRLIEVSGFPCLTTLDKNQFRILASLGKLSLDKLPKLHTVPGEVISVSLKHLAIFGCNELHRVSGEDLPTTLESLSIQSSRNCQIILQNGLPASLKTCVIDGCEELKNCDELNGIAGSLKRLIIRNCDGLKSMSVRLYLTELEIMNCRNLKTMPAKYFPNCLQRLCITECPLLAKKCKPENGEYWSYISLVPYVIIDGDTLVS